MWTFETSGRGRRATVLGVSDGTTTFSPGDFVEYDDFVGVVAGFKIGETENTHQVELLKLVRDGDDNSKESTDSDELFATSIMKWYPLGGIGAKLEPKPQPKRAVDHHWHHKDKVADVGMECTQDVVAYANHVASLFVRTPSPRKRRAQGSRKLQALAAEIEPDSGDSSSEFSLDEEDEPLPARKRNEELKQSATPQAVRVAQSALEAATLNSPKKSPSRSPAKRRRAASVKTEAILPDAATSVATEKDEGLLGALGNENERRPGEEEDEGDGEDDMRVPLSIGKPQSTLKKTSNKALVPKILPYAPGAVQTTDVDRVIARLHPASEPPTHAARDDQYDRLFFAIEGAIAAETGTCVYVSGTPGTGKTSVVKEVLSQIDLRVHDNELRPFSYVEINGMKLVHPSGAYELLWDSLGRGAMAASNAMTALEAAFTQPEPLEKRGVIVVLLDELDQLVTKGQQLMYNFFNWPSLPHSRLVVIAIANTMDLPERILSNKISSRVGLTRIQFPGYSHSELREIVLQRLGPDANILEPEALDYVTRKVAGVGGDARRVLDFVRRGIIRAQRDYAETQDSAGGTSGQNGGAPGASGPHGDPDEKSSSTFGFSVKTAHIRDVIVKTQTQSQQLFIRTLGVASKVLLCAILTRARRSDGIEVPLHDVLKQASQLVRASSDSELLEKYLYPTRSVLGRSGRLAMFRHAVIELVEAGVLVQQAIQGEATPNVRLMIPANTLKEYLEHDPAVKDMV